MHFDDLYSEYMAATHDRQSSIENPAKILVCTTPRTAGHAYCQVLQQFGLGIPTEYFQWQYALPLMRRWSADDAMDLEKLDRQAPAYGRHLLEKRTRNGVFGAKIFFENLPFARNSIGDDDSHSFYVFLSRKNKVDQTISLLSVLHTGQPFDSQVTLPGIPTVPSLSEKVVRATAQHIFDSEIRWKNYLNTLDGRRVAHVCYEDFIANQQENASATMGNWFGGFDFKSKAISTGKRYAHDVEFKTMIGRQFGEFIRRFWREHT
ncbi:Stf0 family sulfotransferase [Mesorhizobium sp. dw_380]|uniref:Stf0 family sulfotransferase n=1 Tax=Mesorhizobium sp. dw_380 TaxID=2812001 RepID=UPI001BDE68E4|nr:Stf0 family sulfotransferase [Mesorhizobium sp. dw_380]